MEGSRNEDDLLPPVPPELQVTNKPPTPSNKRAREGTNSSDNQGSLSARKKTNQTRGKDWNEQDSLLLIDAFAWAKGQKQCILICLKSS